MPDSKLGVLHTLPPSHTNLRVMYLTVKFLFNYCPVDKYHEREIQSLAGYFLFRVF